MSPDERVATTEQAVLSAISDPAASYWLRDAARAAIARDPVDAVKDAEQLLGLLLPWATAIVDAELARAAEPTLPYASDAASLGQITQ